MPALETPVPVEHRPSQLVAVQCVAARRREEMLRRTTWLLVLQAAGGFHVGAPRNARSAVVRRASDADLLAAAAGVGRGMAAKRKNKHVNKYQKKDVKEDPWERAMRRAEEQQEEEAAPPTYALQADCFCEGAALARKRRASTKPVLDFDARDPSTFGFQELGRVVGAHGVRGSLRVDAPSAVDVEMALSAAGLRYLRLASRRTPRPVVVQSCRELKRLGRRCATSWR